MSLPKINDEVVDALVCGELSGDAYRQAIQQLDAYPDRWRDCALAFLREQALTQTMRQLAGQSVNWQNVDFLAENFSFENGASDHRADTQFDNDDSRPTLPVKNWSYGNRWLGLISLAATALLGFVIGQSWNGPSVTTNSGVEKIASRDSAPNTSANTMLTIADVISARSALVPAIENRQTNFDDNKNNKRVDYGNFTGQVLPIDLAIPERLRELERLGKIRIDSANAVMPFSRNDGTSVLVPVQQLQIVPVVYSY